MTKLGKLNFFLSTATVKSMLDLTFRQHGLTHNNNLVFLGYACKWKFFLGLEDQEECSRDSKYIPFLTSQILSQANFGLSANEKEETFASNDNNYY